MTVLDDNESARRARRAYELGRSRFALLRGVPLLALALGYTWLWEGSAASVAIGVLLFAVSFVFAWRGRVAGRAILPGFAAGLVSLWCAHAAPACERTCIGGVTLSFYVLMCTLGGFASGTLITLLARRNPGVARFWLCAGAVALLTGSLACSCVGVGGVLGIAAGLALTGAPVLARRACT
ncbi:MAG TPA: hypothetical protein VFS43_20895 [Polyangiaceae bacterium]|nr:hypothetical protein [Polyangiaceae bacterium]